MLWKTLILLLMLPLVVCGQLNKPKDWQPPEEFNQGVEKFQSGDVEGAILLWKKALAKDSTFGAVWFNLGVAYEMTERESLAEQHYINALKYSPDDATAWNYLGRIYRGWELYDRAAECYEKYLALEPDDVSALNSLGILYDQLGRYNEALTTFDYALAIDKDFLDAAVNKVIVLGHMRRFDDVVKNAKIILSQYPNEPITWAHLGLAYHYLGKNVDAMSALDSSLSIYPDLAIARYYRALVHLSFGNNNEALYDIAKAVELDTDYRAIASQDSELVPLHNDLRFRELIWGK